MLARFLDAARHPSARTRGLERTLAFVLLVVVVAAGQYKLQRDASGRARSAQIAACERGNKLRRELNAMGVPRLHFTKAETHVDCVNAIDHPKPAKPLGTLGSDSVTQTTALLAVLLDG